MEPDSVAGRVRALLGVMLLFTLVTASSPPPAAAQTVGSASMRGIVTDESGAGIPGVTVTVRSPALQLRERTIVTEPSGEYLIRDLPIGDRDTYLVLPVARVRCPQCGPTTEQISWLDRYQRMTKRLVEKIAHLATIAAIKHVAAWFGLSWDTVKQIDRRALERRLGPVNLQGVRRIAIDEFALHRGQTYATLVVDVDTRRVLWVGRGRAREHLRCGDLPGV